MDSQRYISSNMKFPSFFRDRAAYDEIFNTLEQSNGKITGIGITISA
jgi:hypothetical protein